MPPHVSLDEMPSVWGDPVDVLDVEDSKVFDFSDGFLTHRMFRLVEAVECKVLLDLGVSSRIVKGRSYPDARPFLITSSWCRSTGAFFLWVTYSSRMSLASNGPKTFSSSVRRIDIQKWWWTNLIDMLSR